MTTPELGKLIAFARAGERRELADEQLVVACADGDRGALAELFRRHGDRVARVLSRARGVDPPDMEDLVQSTFLEVGRSAHSFDGRSAVATWILAVALNLARNHVRGEVRRRSLLNAFAAAPPPAPPRVPDDQASRRQTIERLQAAAAALPEKLRTVLVLVDIEGMKGSEAARALRIPEGSLWRRLHEAHQRLRSFVGKDGR
jgi:RNA polymerase sigma-70 factor (ECF subfamily)